MNEGMDEWMDGRANFLRWATSSLSDLFAEAPFLSTYPGYFCSELLPSYTISFEASAPLHAAVTMRSATSSCNPACDAASLTLCCAQPCLAFCHSRLPTSIAGASHQIDRFNFCTFFWVKSSSRYSRVTFCWPDLPKVLRVFGILKWKSSSRYCPVHFLSETFPDGGARPRKPKHYFGDPTSHITRKNAGLFTREFTGFRTLVDDAWWRGKHYDAVVCGRHDDEVNMMMLLTWWWECKPWPSSITRKFSSTTSFDDRSCHYNRF